MIARSLGFCALLLAAAPVFAAEPQWLTDARAREGQLGSLQRVVILGAGKN